jgi:hypothetical protein
MKFLASKVDLCVLINKANISFVAFTAVMFRVLLGYNAVSCCCGVATFSLVTPKMEAAWASENWYHTTTLHGITNQKTST